MTLLWQLPPARFAEQDGVLRPQLRHRGTAVSSAYSLNVPETLAQHGVEGKER